MSLRRFYPPLALLYQRKRATNLITKPQAVKIRLRSTSLANLTLNYSRNHLLTSSLEQTRWESISRLPFSCTLPLPEAPRCLSSSLCSLWLGLLQLQPCYPARTFRRANHARRLPRSSKMQLFMELGRLFRGIYSDQSPRYTMCPQTSRQSTFESLSKRPFIRLARPQSSPPTLASTTSFWTFS